MSSTIVSSVRDGLAADEGMERSWAVENDLLGEQRAGRGDVSAFDRGLAKAPGCLCGSAILFGYATALLGGFPPDLDRDLLDRQRDRRLRLGWP